MTVSVTAVVRGFKVSVAVLDRFLAANGVTETDGYSPFYDRTLDDASKLLRAKVNRHRSASAYVAYAWVFVNAQRKLQIAEELPDKAPEGFAELRDEIMGFSDANAKGAEGEPHQDDLTGLFVVVTDEQAFHFTEPFVRKSDLHCADCGADFPDFLAKVAHRRDVHGTGEDIYNLPDDL